MSVVDGKRIAKNTLLLYIRMGVVMIVSLFTTRVLLNSLGEVDYGLNNVVGTLILVFAYVNGALTAASSRFLSFSLGEQNGCNVEAVFNTAFRVHCILAAVVLILGECIGYFLVNYLLVIPDGRLTACNYVFQFSLIASVFSIIQAPLNALVISYERMNVYAYIGVFEALAKCVIAYLIYKATVDRLILLSSLQLLVASAVFVFYVFYTKKWLHVKLNLKEKIDFACLKQMIGYSSWSLLGSTATMLKNYGVNVLINLFFNPVVNAANAIAYQVNAAVTGFSNNFTMAMNPQIVKSYAAQQFEDMKRLVFRGGKVTFFLLSFLCMPIIFEADYILKLWLKNVPDYCVILTRLVLILTLVESFAYTIGSAVQATGKIRDYQFVISGMSLMNFPITYLLFWLGCEPQTALMVSIGISTTNIFLRFYFMKKLLNISPLEYAGSVLLPAVSAVVFSVVPVLFICLNLEQSMMRLMVVVFCFLAFNAISVYYVGLRPQERRIVFDFFRKK